MRAYTQASQAGIAESTVITRVTGYLLKIGTDYTGLGKIQYLLAQRGIQMIESNYTERVEVSVLIPEEEEAGLIRELTEATNGQAVMERVKECCFANVDGEMMIFE